jgi:hypothetical protein
LKIILVISILTLNVFANCVFFISQEFEYKGKKYKPCEDYQVVYDYSTKIGDNKWTYEYPNLKDKTFRYNEIFYNGLNDNRKLYYNKKSLIFKDDNVSYGLVTIKKQLFKKDSPFYNNIPETFFEDGKYKLDLQKKIWNYFFLSDSIKKKDSRLYIFVLDDSFNSEINARVYSSNEFFNLEKGKLLKKIEIKDIVKDNINNCNTFDQIREDPVNDLAVRNYKDYMSRSDLIIEDFKEGLLYFLYPTIGDGDIENHILKRVYHTMILDIENNYIIYKNICDE